MTLQRHLFITNGLVPPVRRNPVRYQLSLSVLVTQTRPREIFPKTKFSSTLGMI